MIVIPGMQGDRVVIDGHRPPPHILTLRGNRRVSFLLLLLALLLLQARGSNE